MFCKIKNSVLQINGCYNLRVSEPSEPKGIFTALRLCHKIILYIISNTAHWTPGCV